MTRSHFLEVRPNKREVLWRDETPHSPSLVSWQWAATHQTTCWSNSKKTIWVIPTLRFSKKHLTTWLLFAAQLCPKRNAPFPVPERGTFLGNGTGTLYISSGLESKVKERPFSKLFFPFQPPHHKHRFKRKKPLKYERFHVRLTLNWLIKPC